MRLHTGGDQERAGYLVRVAQGRDQVGELAQRLADLAPAERVGYLARLERCIRAAHQAGGQRARNCG